MIFEWFIFCIDDFTTGFGHLAPHKSETSFWGFLIALDVGNFCRNNVFDIYKATLVNKDLEVILLLLLLKLN